jgi:hypothetical protein
MRRNYTQSAQECFLQFLSFTEAYHYHYLLRSVSIQLSLGKAVRRKGEGTPRKLAGATQPQFPRIVISLSWTQVTEWSSAYWGNCVAVSSICAAPFSNIRSSQADKNSRKLRLRCGCQFPWCAFGLRVDKCSEVFSILLTLVTINNFQIYHC